MGLDRVAADLERAQAEVKRLEGQLEAARGRVAKLAAFMDVAREYGVLAADQAVPSGPQGVDRPEGATPPPMKPPRETGGRKGLVVRTAVEVLRAAGHPLSASHIVEELGRRGVIVSNKPDRAVADLSSYLSSSREQGLRGKRGVGWALAEWGDDPFASTLGAEEAPAAVGINGETTS